MAKDVEPVSEEIGSQDHKDDLEAHGEMAGPQRQLEPARFTPVHERHGSKERQYLGQDRLDHDEEEEIVTHVPSYGLPIELVGGARLKPRNGQHAKHD